MLDCCHPLMRWAVLAIATRHWQHRPKLHRLAMAYACEAVSQALVDGVQPVETCQALVLLTVFPAPFQRWSENRSWLLIGAAIRCVVLDVRVRAYTCANAASGSLTSCDWTFPHQQGCLSERDSIVSGPGFLSCLLTIRIVFSKGGLPLSRGMVSPIKYSTYGIDPPQSTCRTTSTAQHILIQCA